LWHITTIWILGRVSVRP